MLRIVLFPTQRKAAEARPGGEGQPGQGCHVAEAAARGEGEVGDTGVREGEEEVEAVVLEVLAADLGEGGRGEGREGAGRGWGRAKGGEGRKGKDELGLGHALASAKDVERRNRWSDKEHRSPANVCDRWRERGVRGVVYSHGRL